MDTSAGNIEDEAVQTIMHGDFGMTSFPAWLEQVGLAHCGPILTSNGIDYEAAAKLTLDDLRRLGLNQNDGQRLLQAIASQAQLPGVSAAASPATHASPEERRPITVMFCDLVDFSGLSQRLDPEILRPVMKAYRSVCSGVVSRYEGHVAQVLGDGVMAYFGWPLAHENDAERGVRAALEIVSAVKGVSAPEPLAVHVGVATGEVVVGGPSGPGDGDAGLAVGETPNLAARLQGMAGTDEIFVAHSTRRLVGDVFDLIDLGALPLKGIGSSRAWRVRAVRPAAGRFDAAHGGAPLSALVGREEELSLLLDSWGKARGGAGRAVLISGEPGIGKSRLTEVLRERISAEPHSTLRYQCSPFHRNAALYPIVAHLELAAGFAREDTPQQELDKLERLLAGGEAQRAEAAPLLAALLSLPAERYSPLELSAQSRKERTLEVLVDQVEALSQTQPVLMILEDAHWIDPTSQDLLDKMVPRLPGQRIMLVLTYRPQQYSPRWTELPQVTTLSLTGLAREQGVELAGNVAKGKTLPPEVVEQLVMRADGVPLFIEELTKSVLESELLVEEADRYTLPKPLPALAIPTTLSALLIERLGRREGVRELAQIGACIGRVFSYELLLAVSAKKGREFEEELEQLTKTELVFRHGTPPDATYTFKHALVQDAAYDSLLKSKRHQLHGQIAEVLESEFPHAVAREPEQLARHHTEAGRLAAAIPLWRRAGESALARVALQEAVAYLEKGLALIDRLDPSADRDRLELSLREPLHSARLRWRGWAAPEVRVNANAILTLAERQKQPQSLLVGLWGMWINTITQGRVAEALDWARRLLVEGRQAGNIDLTILGHRAALSSHFYLGELEEAREQRDKVLALYEPTRAGRWSELTGNDVRTAVGVFTSQALWMLGYPDQAAQLSDQKDSDSRRLGHPFDVSWALTWGAYVFDYRCEPDRLLARVDEADRRGREQSIPLVYKVLVPIGRGLAMLRKGELSEAIAFLTLGIDGWRASGGNLNLPYLKSAMAEAMARQGDLAGGLRLLDECLEQIERPGWHERVWLAEILRLKGWTLMRQGRRSEAEEQLRSSIAWARLQEARSWELRSSTTLAQLLAESGQRAAARDVLAPSYDSFTEGFDTHDLTAARSLLEELR